MDNPMQKTIGKSIVKGSNEDLNSNKRKRNRITKKSEVTVHQWTFSTEVK